MCICFPQHITVRNAHVANLRATDWRVNAVGRFVVGCWSGFFVDKFIVFIWLLVYVCVFCGLFICLCSLFVCDVCLLVYVVVFVIDWLLVCFAFA